MIPLVSNEIAYGLVLAMGLKIKEVAVEIKNTCTVDFNGQSFPGYLQGGDAYFGEGVKVKNVANAANAQVSWDEKNKVVIVR